MKTIKTIVLLIAILAIYGCDQGIKTTGVDESIITPEGFVVQKLFSPDDHGMGSWVSLASDDQGRIYASDQYGQIYRMAASENPIDSVDIENLGVNIGSAQGMLWAYNSLYVMVNSYGNDHYQSGLYRVFDSNKDDLPDSVVLMQPFDGAGEHGPHAIIKGPDNMLYIIAGNHTDIPDNFDTLVPDIWAEDNILPVIKDPRGHAANRKAPGGWIARTDSVGSKFELFAVGFRNAYDIAFNELGDMFTFDSDMEWDLGSPWYRPIRVCHVMEGADFGWRTGSGKFPDYFPDNLPAVVNIGQGSPTGVLWGRGLQFPSRFQDGLFILDWSFGTIYFVELSADGATYAGEPEEFLSGKPLPLTDAITVNGAMYFAIGGRRLESGLYRVSYAGTEDTSTKEKQEKAEPGSPVEIRQQLVRLHNDTSKAQLDFIWEALNHEDRFVRFAARTALERRDDHTWYDRLRTEDNPSILIQGIIATARLGLPIDAAESYKLLSQIDMEGLSRGMKLDMIRAWQLLIIRYGIEENEKALTREKMSGMFPSSDYDMDRELLRTLMTVNDEATLKKAIEIISQPMEEQDNARFLDEEVIERSEQYGEVIALMRRNNPQTRRLAYLEAISVADKYWTDELRETYFSAFNQVFASTGGMSFKGFAKKMIERALVNIPEDQHDYYMNMTGAALAQVNDADLAELPQPEGPGRAWDEAALKEVLKDLEKGDQENGQRMYQAVLCSSCHMKNGAGSDLGPELSTLGSRFSVDDIIRSVVYPSETVSDQYATTLYVMQDSSHVQGRVLNMDGDTLFVNTNPFNARAIKKILKTDVLSEKPTTLSMMPPGLLNRLNAEEVRDLFSYLLN